MGKIKNALGRVLPFIPRGSTQKDFVRGSIKRRLEPFDNRIIGLTGDLESNSDIFASILNSQVNDLVGTGIKPTLDTGDAALDLRLARLFEQWAEDCESSGLSWLQAAALIVRLWIRDGECFVLTPAGGRIQILAAEDLPAMPMNQGIEIDGAGRPVAYLFKPGMEGMRVDARAVLHIAHRTNPSHRQLRGVSPLLGSYGRVDALRRYLSAEEEAAAASAKVAFFIKQSSGEEYLDRDPETGDLEELPNGMVLDRLGPQDDVVSLNSHRPHSQTTEFSALLMRSIAAATGSDYCAISRDSPGSFSAARHLTVIAQRDADARFAQLRKQVVDPLWRWLVTGWQQQGLVALTEATRWPAMHPSFLRTGKPAQIDVRSSANAATLLYKEKLIDREEARTYLSGFDE